ncbi:2347_t:CDS:1, partial [Gigaspora margarita]
APQRQVPTSENSEQGVLYNTNTVRTVTDYVSNTTHEYTSTNIATDLMAQTIANIELDNY